MNKTIFNRVEVLCNTPLNAKNFITAMNQHLLSFTKYLLEY